MRKFLFSSLFAALALSLCGCGPSRFGPELQYEEVQEPRGRLEAIPPQVEILEQVQKTPTDFVVPFSESRYAWERAELFFKKHTSESRFTAGKGDAVLLSNEGKTERINYAVQRRGGPTGTRFTLRCDSPLADVSTREIDLQCRNLARFIRDGVLEESFVAR